MLLLLIWPIACAKAPQHKWAEALQFHYHSDLGKWEVSKVGLDQFFADCKFAPSATDDPVVASSVIGQVLITDALYEAIINACEDHQKSLKSH